jgi:hypothetical protein
VAALGGVVPACAALAGAVRSLGEERTAPLVALGLGLAAASGLLCRFLLQGPGGPGPVPATGLTLAGGGPAPGTALALEGGGTPSGFTSRLRLEPLLALLGVGGTGAPCALRLEADRATFACAGSTLAFRSGAAGTAVEARLLARGRDSRMTLDAAVPEEGLQLSSEAGGLRAFCEIQAGSVVLGLARETVLLCSLRLTADHVRLEHSGALVRLARHRLLFDPVDELSGRITDADAWLEIA